MIAAALLIVMCLGAIGFVGFLIAGCLDHIHKDLHRIAVAMEKRK